ncbi:MAG: hypothetical protein ABIC40_03750 [bacterium]
MTRGVFPLVKKQAGKFSLGIRSGLFCRACQEKLGQYVIAGFLSTLPYSFLSMGAMSIGFAMIFAYTSKWIKLSPILNPPESIGKLLGSYRESLRNLWPYLYELARCNLTVAELVARAREKTNLPPRAIYAAFRAIEWAGEYSRSIGI